jgi:bifunctional non-homologous end joining protein LigD
MPSRARKRDDGASGVGPARTDAPDARPKPSPTGRRQSAQPLIEIARAATKEEALAGFERWKSRHAGVVAHLEPADLLVDSMRGRSTLWYRIRVNLQHVPEAERPSQEPLDADYDPWSVGRQSTEPR